MIRQVLGLVRVACLFIWPPDIYVRTRVDHAGADLLAEREEHVDVMEPWRFGPVAGVAAGTGPGQVCGVPLASPCPGQPQEPEHVAELVRYHHVTANQMDGVYCHCGHVSHNDRRHAHHVAGLVEDMIAADVRLANRFHKS